MWELVLKVFWAIFGPIIETDISKAISSFFGKHVKAKLLKLIGKSS